MLKKVFALQRAAAFAAATALAFTLAMPAQAHESNAISNVASSQENGRSVKAPKVKKYCFLFETTGSRMKTKVCKTRTEWEAEGQEIEMK